MKLSLIIPAYNEEKRISATLSEYLAFFSRKLRDFEIIIMVEGTDGTLDIVKSYAERDRRIKYFYSKERLGKGGAVVAGFRQAKGDIVGFVDADNSTKSEAFIDLLKCIEGADGAIANRWDKKSKIVRKEPVLQQIGSRGFNVLVRCMFLLPFKDTQCGAKLFRRSAAREIIDHLQITEWAFDIDMLYTLKRKRFKIKAAPTVWEYKTGANFNFKKWFTKLVPEMLIAIIRLRLMYSPLKAIVRIYDKLFAAKVRNS